MTPEVHESGGGPVTRLDLKGRFTVRLPFPDPSLSPNRKNGKHWSVTHAAKSASFKAGYERTYDAMRHFGGAWYPTNGTVPVTLTFYPPDKRKRDLDNLLAASKAVLDGVAAALLMDDREFEPVTLKRGEVRKGAGEMVLEVGHG